MRCAYSVDFSDNVTCEAIPEESGEYQESEVDTNINDVPPTDTMILSFGKNALAPPPLP
jgi:hypothetical protein